jgi:hypothetical protein
MSRDGKKIKQECTGVSKGNVAYCPLFKNKGEVVYYSYCKKCKYFKEVKK